jgi:hypothetical protein
VRVREPERRAKVRLGSRRHLMQICNSKLVCMEHPRKLERSARRQEKWVRISAAYSAKHKSQQLVGVCLELRRQCDSVSIRERGVSTTRCAVRTSLVEVVVVVVVVARQARLISSSAARGRAAMQKQKQARCACCKEVRRWGR